MFLFNVKKALEYITPLKGLEKKKDLKYPSSLNRNQKESRGTPDTAKIR